MAPAEIRPNFHIRPRPDIAAGYEVGFDHLSMHLPHCVIGQEFIVLQMHSFINLTVYREILMIAMVLLFTLVRFIAGYTVMLCDVA